MLWTGHQARQGFLLFERGRLCIWATLHTTGVSFARYERLVDLISVACAEDERGTPAVPLLLCWVWLQAETKQCLLDFILAVDTHRPILAEGSIALRSNIGYRKEWAALAFSTEELREVMPRCGSVAGLAGS